MMLKSVSISLLVAVAFATPHGNTRRADQCGLKGYQKNTEPYNSFQGAAVANFTQCKAKCQANSQCKSFAFDKTWCHVYKRTLAQNLDQDPDSEFWFYDKNCPASSAPTSSTTTVRSTTSTRTTSTTASSATTTKATTTTTTTTTRTATTTSAAAVSTATPSCGVKGYDRGNPGASFFYNTPANVGTLAGCAAKCKAQGSKCKSLAYGSSQCLLYSANVAGNWDSVASSPFTFYDVACPAVTPPASTTTTLTTTSTTTTTTTPTPTAAPFGTFDDGYYTGWDNRFPPAGVNVSVVSPGYGNTAYGVLFTFDAGPTYNYNSLEFNGVGTAPKIGLSPGVEYELQAYVKMTTTGQCIIKFGAGNSLVMSAGVTPYESAPIAINEWVKLRGSFVAGSWEQYSVTVMCYNLQSQGSQVYMDQLTAVPISSTVYTTASPPTGPELNLNPNFVKDSTTPGYSVVSQENGATYDDNGSLTLNFPAGTNSPSFDILAPLADTVIDAVYLVSLDIMWDLAYPSSCSLRVSFMGGDFSSHLPVFLFGSDGTSLPAGQWHTLSGLATASGVKSKLQFHMHNVGVVATANSFHVRTISVRKLSP